MSGRHADPAEATGAAAAEDRASARPALNASVSLPSRSTDLFFAPYLAARRARDANTRPASFSKDEIARMSQDPGAHEKELRAVSASLAGSTRTYDLILQTYQDMMKYCWFVTPTGRARPGDYDLADAIARRMDPSALGHRIVGLCAQYGKVFFTPRVSVDTRNRRVRYAFLQQLPEDFCTITGRTDGPGGYTVAFDTSYFDLPGTDPAEYGPVFAKLTRNRHCPENTDIRGHQTRSGSLPEPRLLDLDPGRVLVFELNDRTIAAAPPLTGLMAGMTQIPAYEAAQLEIVLNPLTSVMTGELETQDMRGISAAADPIRVSPTTRRVFEELWYRMLEACNTGGIGLYLAPARNLQLQTVSDSVASTEIASSAIGEQILKSGLPALIPTTNDPKVDVASLSAGVHAQYALPVYRALERFFNALFDELGLGARFHMFGDIFTWDADLQAAREGAAAGNAADILRYNAMMGLSPDEAEACRRLTEANKASKEESPSNTG